MTISNNNRPLANDADTLMAKNRFLVLFVVLMAFMAAMPIVSIWIEPDNALWSRTIVAVLFSAILIYVITLVTKLRAVRIAAIALAAPAIALQGLNLVTPNPAVQLTSHAFAMTFLVLTIGTIGHALFRAKRITTDEVASSLCIYLFMVILWAVAYSALELVAQGSFTYSLSEAGAAAPMVFGGELSVFPVYFSFVTITTLGYGDVLPATPAAQMLASIEAFLGQIYVAVLVARFVGVHISQSLLEE